MRLVSYCLLALATISAACESPGTTATADKAAATTTATAMTDSPNADPAAATPPTAENTPYRLLGVVDPEFRMVAFALKVPRSWQVKQSFQRQLVNGLPSDKVYLSLRSADGSQQIEYLPRTDYFYTEGPSRQQLEAQMRQMGMTPPRQPNEQPPMAAPAYLKQILLPQLAQNGLRLRNPGNEQHTPPRQTDPQTTKSQASIDGELPDGRKVRVEARLAVNVARSGNDVYYAWGVVPSITQTSAANDLAATCQHTRVAQESITPNPAWQKQWRAQSDQLIQANGETMRQNNAAFEANMQRNHEARMADIARSGAANTARHEARQATADQQVAAYNERSASQDRQHEYYVDNAIRNETKYHNPGTGEQVKVDNRYQHIYTDNKGTYYGTNTPIEPAHVDWQELQRVSQQDY